MRFSGSIRTSKLPGGAWVASLGEISWLCKGVNDYEPLCEHTYPTHEYLAYLRSRRFCDPACTLCHVDAPNEENEDGTSDTEPPSRDETEEEAESMEEEPSLGKTDPLVDLSVVKRAISINAKARPLRYIKFERGKGPTFLDSLTREASSVGALLKKAEFVKQTGDSIFFVTRVPWAEPKQNAISEIVDALYRFHETSKKTLSLMQGYGAIEIDQDLLRYPDKHPFDYFDPLQPLQVLLAWKADTPIGMSLRTDTANVRLVGVATYKDNLFRGGPKDWIRNRLEMYGAIPTTDSHTRLLVNFLFDAIGRKVDLAKASNTDYETAREVNADIVGLVDFLKTNNITRFEPPKQDLPVSRQAESIPIFGKGVQLESFGRVPTLLELQAFNDRGVVFSTTPREGTYEFDELELSPLPGARLAMTPDRGWGTFAARDFKPGEVITAYFPVNYITVARGSEEEKSLRGSHQIELVFKTATEKFYVDGAIEDPRVIEKGPHGDKWIGAFTNEATKRGATDMNCMLWSRSRNWGVSPARVEDEVIVFVATREIREGEELLTYYGPNYTREGYSIGFSRDEAERNYLAADVASGEMIAQKRERLKQMRRWSVILKDARKGILDPDENGLTIYGRNILRVFYDTDDNSLFSYPGQHNPFYADVQRLALISRKVEELMDNDVVQSEARELAKESLPPTNVGSLVTRIDDNFAVQGMLYQLAVDDSELRRVDVMLLEAIASNLVKSANRLGELLPYPPLVFLLAVLPTTATIQGVTELRRRNIERFTKRLEKTIAAKVPQILSDKQKELATAISELDVSLLQSTEAFSAQEKTTKVARDKAEEISKAFASISLTNREAVQKQMRSLEEARTALVAADEELAKLNGIQYEMDRLKVSSSRKKKELDSIDIEIAEWKASNKAERIRLRDELKNQRDLLTESEEKVKSVNEKIAAAANALQSLGFTQREVSPFRAPSVEYLSSAFISGNLAAAPLFSSSV